MKSWAFIVALLALLLSLSATGCRCSSDEVLATLTARQGNVTRDTRSTLAQWVDAKVNGTFSLGDGVRTLEQSTAMLELADASRLKIQPKTILRFTDTLPGANQHAFDVAMGGAILETGKRGVVLKTSLGLARIEANSKVVLKRVDRGLWFEVQVGTARLESGEARRTLKRSEVAVLTGQAVVHELRDAAAPRAAPETSGQVPPKVANIADLITGLVEGRGVSLKQPGKRGFTKLTPGALELRRGSTVRVKKGSRLTISHRGTTAALTGDGTYNVAGAPGALVTVEHGSLSLRGDSTRVLVPGGAIVTNDGTSASVASVSNGTRIRVQIGKVSIEGASGATEVAAGQEALLDRDGAIKLEGVGLAYADIVVDAGESFVVHDPMPPTAVRFQFAGACADGGVVKVKGRTNPGFAVGKGSVALPFPPGQYDYSLQCLQADGLGGPAVASGRLTVVKDAGTRPMPKAPPATGIETDGRTYTVVYQNQLPRVSLSWSNAPPDAQSFSLVHRSPAGTKKYSTNSPSYTFVSGALSAGTHVFYFEGGNKVSRWTTIRIRFDNKAPTATLKTPANLAAAPGDRVTIAGVAQLGWRVEIDGKPALLDAQQQFNQEAAMPTDERALVVRLTHPRHGTHIYLRRATDHHD